MNNNDASLKIFNLNDMVPNPSILIIGKRTNEKNCIIGKLMHHISSPTNMVISPTEKYNPFYGKFVKDLFINEKMKKTQLKNILERQTKIIANSTQLYNQSIHMDDFVPALIVFDDCMHTLKNWQNCDVLNEIFMNGRHYQLSTITSSSTLNGFSPQAIQNFDYVFILPDVCDATKNETQEKCAQFFPTFNEFKNVFQRVYDACCTDYRAMVINNRNIGDKIFYFQATSKTHDMSTLNIIRDDLGWRHAPTNMTELNIMGPYLCWNHAPTILCNSDGSFYTREMVECFVDSEKFRALCGPSFDGGVSGLYMRNESESDSDREDYCEQYNADPSSHKIKTPDTNSPQQNATKTQENHDCDMSEKPIHVNNTESIQLAYRDDNYHFVAKLTNLTNSEIVRTLCDHIFNLKQLEKSNIVSRDK